MDHQFAFPSSGLLPATEKLTCPQCGCDAFQLFHCPERKHAACSYVRRWGGRKGSIWNILFLIVFFGVLTAGMFHTQWMLLIVPAIGLLAWLATIDQQQYKPNSGTVLEGTSVFGHTVRLRVMTKQESVSLAFAPASLPRHPLSVVTLWGLSSNPDEDYRATSVFRAALVELLLWDLIAIQPVTICIPGENRTVRAQSTDCCVIKGSSTSAAVKLGWLEAAILRIVEYGDWTQSERDGWLDGPQVYELVRAYLGHDRTNPHRELLRDSKSAADLIAAQHAAHGGPNQNT